MALQLSFIILGIMLLKDALYSLSTMEAMKYSCLLLDHKSVMRDLKGEALKNGAYFSLSLVTNNH